MYTKKRTLGRKYDFVQTPLLDIEGKPIPVENVNKIPADILSRYRSRLTTMTIQNRSRTGLIKKPFVQVWASPFPKRISTVKRPDGYDASYDLINAMGNFTPAYLRRLPQFYFSATGELLEPGDKNFVFACHALKLESAKRKFNNFQNDNK